MVINYAQPKKKWGEKMIDKITESLTNKIKKEMPDIDDERSEIINYGLQLIIGEIPKLFIMLGIAYLLGVFKLSIMMVLILLPYRLASGGFHLKTHIGCIISTSAFYSGIPLLAKSIILNIYVKYLLLLIIFVFGIFMISLYAPADTENVPIISTKERRKKKIQSYIFFTIGLAATLFINNNIISNIIIFGYFAQTCAITRFAYKLTNNKFGYELYKEVSN